MADRAAPGSSAAPGAEHVLDEAHLAVRVAGCSPSLRDDAGGFLPAMLERVQAEVRDVGGLGVAVDAEDAAHGVGVERLTYTGSARLASLPEEAAATVPP